MDVRKIAHKPELTSDEAQAVFARHFAGRYEVEPCESPMSSTTKYQDFQVVKNPFLAVALKLEQAPAETRFVYAAVPPRRWIQTLSLGTAGIYCLVFGKSVTREVENFIESAPEFSQ
jgi:hypothetical protein